MAAFPSELDSLITQVTPQADILGSDDSSFDQQVQAQVEQLGNEPSLLQAVTVLLKQSAKSEHEARQARQLQQQQLRETAKVVRTHHSEIEILKEGFTDTNTKVSEVKDSQGKFEQRMCQVEYFVNKTYNLECENRQRSCKGNFILSGKHIPRTRPREDLLSMVTDMVFRKYEVEIQPQEFKDLHRLAGDRIFFSLHSRMPGWSYEQLVRKMNSNPRAELEIYICIQLFEPYSDIFYIARRLKFFKTISYYRLDENGCSYIALNEQTRAFKFTSLDQLSQL